MESGQLPDLSEGFRKPDYPRCAKGSCLIVGTPAARLKEEDEGPEDTSLKNEPLPVDYFRAIAHAVLSTRANLTISPEDGCTSTRVEVAGYAPRAVCTPKHIDPSTVIRDDVEFSPESEAGQLQVQEYTSAQAGRVIGELFDMPDLRVVTLTDKLRDYDTRGAFLDGIARVRQVWGSTLDVKRGKKVQQEVLLQCLINLIPQWLRKHKSAEEVEILANYAAVKLLWMIRKITKEILFFHARREGRYLPVVKAYLHKWRGTNPGLVDKFVRMPKSIDGTKIVRAKQLKSKDILDVRALDRLSLCEAYRCAEGQENSRFLMHPADSVEDMKRKLMSQDVLDEQRWTYVNDMIVPVLQMARVLLKNSEWARNEVGRLLPPGLLEDTAQIPQNIDQMLLALHQLVLDPLDRAIEVKLKDPIPPHVFNFRPISEEEPEQVDLIGGFQNLGGLNVPSDE